MTVAAYLRANAARFAAELASLVAFPSVSASPAARPHMAACAQWLADHLQRLGGRASIVDTAGHPAVVGRFGDDRRRPTLLIYGHYDVQPPGPAERWTTPPFHPRIAGGYLYGRGASDAKGQLLAHLKAIEMARALGRGLPVNVVVLVEGEEEIGSPHLRPVLAGLPRCDAAVVSDTAMAAIDRPSITYSLRGDLYLEVDVAGRFPDLHSGNFGGGVHNALRVLTAALGTLHDTRGAVAVPGFAADVAPAPPRERRFMRDTGPSAHEIRDEAGGAPLAGERAFSPYERVTIRPSIEISGVSGGYTGAGVHGVIPSHARATLDIRLVPHQDPDRIHRAVFAHLARGVPRGLALRTRVRMRARPVVIDRRRAVMRAAARAYRRGFGVAPSFLRSGGSIPVVSTLVDTLRIPTVLMGFALADDRAHGPDERYSLAMLGRAIATSAAFLEELAR